MVCLLTLTEGWTVDRKIGSWQRRSNYCPADKPITSGAIDPNQTQRNARKKFETFSQCAVCGWGTTFTNYALFLNFNNFEILTGVLACFGGLRVSAKTLTQLLTLLNNTHLVTQPLHYHLNYFSFDLGFLRTDTQSIDFNFCPAQICPASRWPPEIFSWSVITAMIETHLAFWRWDLNNSSSGELLRRKWHLRKLF